MCIHELPFLHAIHFCIVSERLSTQLTSSALRGKAGADFISNVERRAMNPDFAPLAILFMDGVGKGKLGMITTFCRSDQVKWEPSDTLSTLVQQESPGTDVVVVKVFTNLPHLMWGYFGSLYLDVTTLSAGTLRTQFSLAVLHMHRLFPYSPAQVILL